MRLFFLGRKAGAARRWCAVVKSGFRVMVVRLGLSSAVLAVAAPAPALLSLGLGLGCHPASSRGPDLSSRSRSEPRTKPAAANPAKQPPQDAAPDKKLVAELFK